MGATLIDERKSGSWKARSGMMGGELPQTTGREAAGVVDELGEGVEEVAPGDRVYGFVTGAGAAELALLADYGVPVVTAQACSSLEQALAAGERLGWPVAMKTASPEVAHKSEVDGVRLGLRGKADVREAYLDLSRRLGPEVTMAQMAGPGVELALGVVRDDQFGPMVMVAAGGQLVEVLQDHRFALPPVDIARARRMRRSVPDPPMRSTPPDPEPETICRSPDSVALATRQPSPTAPTRCASGTRAPSR